MTAEPTLRRRTLLHALIAVGGAAISGLMAIPGVSYLLDPLLRGRKDQGRWIRVADLSTLDEDVPVSAAVVGEQVDAWTRFPETRLGTVWLRRLGKDSVQALTAECPHLGCAIAFDKDNKHYKCPCHDSAFTREGDVKGGPSPRGMDPLEVRVKDDQVHVRFVRFRPQVRERVEVG